MARGCNQAGYTILEVMMFLAVTSVLFVGAMNSINGRQQAVQFSQSTRDMQSRIQQLINSVSSGFYPNSNNYTCAVPNRTTPTARPTFDSTTPSIQGSSNDCVFLGKILHLAVQDTGNTGTAYETISVAGRRLNASANAQEVSSLAEAIPTAVVGSGVEAVEPDTLQFGLRVTKVIDGSPSSSTTYGSIAFFSTLPRFIGGSSNLISGSQRVSFGGVPSTALNETRATAVSAINAITDSATPPSGVTPINMNPRDGIIICLRDTTNRKAMITIGGANSQARATLETGTLYNTSKCG